MVGMATNRILVIDDEPSVRSVLDRVLRREGYSVTLAPSAKEGLQSLQERPPDAIILDLNLPDMHGEDVCHQIRQNTATQPIPILILTGCATDNLPAQCLDGGADDYLSKPFDTKELVARVRALLRRPRLYVSPDSVIEKKNISMVLAEHRVMVKGHTINDLAPKEFDLLYQLLLHAPKVLDKNTLALKVWGVSTNELNSRTLDVHIQRIRTKLGQTIARCLKTIPAVGYQWLEKK